MTGEARAALAAFDDEQATSGEAGNARALICLAEGDPAGAFGALRGVLDGTAPVIGYLTVIDAQLLAGLAHRALGDQRAANRAAEHVSTYIRSIYAKLGVGGRSSAVQRARELRLLAVGRTG
jgi:hypothetical protein